MCTSPLILNPYKNTFGASLRIPCGQCLECRESAHSNWLYRLGVEFDRLKSDGGTALFLTFTYNDHHLPKSNFGIFIEKKIGDETISIPSPDVTCFNKNDVRDFLNTLKAHMHDLYGKGSYKYFWVSEFGSNTHRPHYHCIFFLRHDVDWFNFTEYCRGTWSHGFLFPKYDAKRSLHSGTPIYVGKDGKKTSPIVQDYGSCGKYASKYITKDLDFLKVPIVSLYMSARKYYSKTLRNVYDKYLPVFSVSKSFGAKSFSPESLLYALQHGVTDHFSHRVVTLPRYYVQSNAFSTLKYEGKLYRVLRDGYESVYRQIVRNSFFNVIHKCQNYLLNINPADFVAVYENTDIAAQNFQFMFINKNINISYAYLNWIYSHLSEKAKDLFRVVSPSLGLSLDAYVNFRVAQLNPFVNLSVRDSRLAEVLSSFDPIYPVDECVKFFDIYFAVISHANKVLNEKSYSDYQKVRKLRLMSKGLL